MSGYGKWIGGAVGWASGGPLGALLGLAVGYLFDQSSAEPETRRRTRNSQKTGGNDFGACLLVLSAAVMQADSRTLRSELNYVKRFFVLQFGAEYTRNQMQVLKQLLNRRIPLASVCDQIRHYMDGPSRLQLLHYLFGIAGADGAVNHNETTVIKNIARLIGIHPSDFTSIKAMFVKDVDNDYRILEISPSASDEELKKAYRRMAVMFHPDKISHLGEKFQQSAKEKFQKVNEAYESIKKKRGMS